MSQTKKFGNISKNWSCNKLNGDQLIKFEDQLIKNEYAIKQLTINLSESRFTNDQLQSLVAVLKKINLSSTINLNLVSCKIDDFQVISDLFLCFKQVPKFQLNINSINMFNGQISYISNSLQQFTNMQQLKLQLSGNSIQDQGMVMLMKSISQISQLENLYLDIERNKLAKEAGIIFSQEIIKCSKLKQLFLNLVDNFSDEYSLLLYIFNDLHKLKQLTDIDVHVAKSMFSPPFQEQFNNDVFLKFFFNLSEITSLRNFCIKFPQYLFNQQKILNKFAESMLQLSNLQSLEVNCMQTLHQIRFINYFKCHDQIKVIYLNVFSSKCTQIREIPKLLKLKRLVKYHF